MPTLIPYRSTTTTLAPGDLLVLYTDGVTEAENSQREQYGEPRLEALLLSHREGSANHLLSTILKDVENFTQGNYNDDVTLLVMKISETIA
jgi:sigma-B regulation protein RsbU (phosphoserine phosphatase)